MSNHLLGQLTAWMYQCISLNYRKSGHEGKLTGIWITKKKIVVKTRVQNDGIQAKNNAYTLLHNG